MEHNWKRKLLSYFFGTFSLSSIVFTALGYMGWQLIIFSIAAAGLITLAYFIVLYKKKKKMQRFFGLDDSSPVNIAISSYYNIKEYDESLGENENMRYYKYVRNSREQEKRLLVGAIEYPLTDIGVASEAIKLSTYISKTGSHKIKLFGDTIVQPTLDGPILCLGSPTSNSITENIFRKLPEKFKLQFTTKTLSCCFHRHEYEFKSTETMDYAILIRFTVNKQVHFVCAGIDEHGTIALSKLLIEKWEELPTDDFINVYRVDKIGCDADLPKITGDSLVHLDLNPC